MKFKAKNLILEDNGGYGLNAVGNVDIEVDGFTARRNNLGAINLENTINTQCIDELRNLVSSIKYILEGYDISNVQREKINKQIHIVSEQLSSGKPKRKMISRAFSKMKNFAFEVSKDVAKDALKDESKELLLKALEQAPKLILAAKAAAELF